MFFPTFPSKICLDLNTAFSHADKGTFDYRDHDEPTNNSSPRQELITQGENNLKNINAET